MAKKWEYLVIELPELKQTDEQRQQQSQQQQVILNGLGKDGWELVAVTPSTGWNGQGHATFSKAYLKREKAQDI